MPPILKNILAIVAGVFIGSVVNMSLVMLGGKMVPVPAGIDVTTMEGLKAGMHLLTPINFLFPFLAHAMGSLVGAFAAALIAAKERRKVMALSIGFLFMLGGLLNIFMLPSPWWFNVLDLGLAYVPMALLGYFLAKKIK
jgi:hypothetical protein